MSYLTEIIDSWSDNASSSSRLARPPIGRTASSRSASRCMSTPSTFCGARRRNLRSGPSTTAAGSGPIGHRCANQRSTGRRSCAAGAAPGCATAISSRSSTSSSPNTPSAETVAADARRASRTASRSTPTSSGRGSTSADASRGRKYGIATTAITSGDGRTGRPRCWQPSCGMPRPQRRPCQRSSRRTDPVEVGELPRTIANVDQHIVCGQPVQHV